MRRNFFFVTLLTLCIKLQGQPTIPVDPLSGRALISIPMIEMTSGSISVPVSLSYNSTGVKPQSSEGSVGMNWDLYAGGQVSREVRGLPDDYNPISDNNDLRRGRLLSYAVEINNFTPGGDDNLSICSDELNNWTFIKDLAYTRDPEPDIFSFNAPGLSGQFVFGPDKTPALIPYQDVKVEFTPTTLDGPIEQIIITKNDGTKYTFTANSKVTRSIKVEYNTPVSQFTTAREHFKKPIKFTSGWSLTGITSQRGDAVTFCYGNGCNDLSAYDNMERVTGGEKIFSYSHSASNSTSPPKKQYTIEDRIEVSDLFSITSRNQKIEFNYTYPGRLLEAKITDRSTSNIKLFRFLYAIAKHSSEQHGKYFLREVREENGFCNSFPAFRFEYYDVTFPSGDSNFGIVPTSILWDQKDSKQDLWGYWNDVAESKNPTIYFYSSKSGAERYRFYPIPGLEETAKINGADRSVNPSKVIFGSLKKILYPTGGTVTITYQPNQYWDAEANTSQYAPGLRVQQIQYDDNVVEGSQSKIIAYAYTKSNGESSGKWIYRSVFGFHDVGNFYASLDDLSPEAGVLYERVSVSQIGKGKTVYQYYLPGSYPLTNDSDWSASLTGIARNGSPNCSTLGQIKKDYFTYPFSPNMNYDFERGLIHKISDFTEAGIPVTEKEFTYQRLGSQVAFVKGLRYELLNGTNLVNNASLNSNIYVFSHYSLMTNVGKVVLTEIQREFDMTDPSKFLETSSTYSYNSVHNMLSEISQTNSAGEIHKSKIKYAKDFASLTQPLATDINSVMIKKLNDEFKHGVVVETALAVVEGSTETITAATLNIFGSIPDSLGAIRVLPVEKRVFSGTSGYIPVSVTPSSGPNQSLTFNSTLYRPSVYFENYDFTGNARTIRSVDKNVNGVHIGYKKTLPVASISNATANEVVYAGFETYSGNEFDIIPASATYVTGKTGKKAIRFGSPPFALEKSTVFKGNSTNYRFTCWFTATTSGSVIFKIYNGTTQVASASASYLSADVNKWKFIEGVISVASANPLFKLKVETTGSNVTLDDIAFYPETASIQSFTYEPMMGKTSESNTRGITTYYEYDAMGRLKYVKDNDLNLRQTMDYYYKVQQYPAINTYFSASHAPYQVVMGTSVTYSIPPNTNCALTPLSYDWYINGIKLGNNVTSFAYTYSAIQKYILKLVITHPTHGSAEAVVEYDVKRIESGPIGVTATDRSGTNSYAFCDAVHTKTFDAALTGCYVLEDVNIEWYFETGSDWVLFTGYDGHGSMAADRLSITFDPVFAFNGPDNMGPYSIRCDVSTVCPVTGVISTDSYIRNISYNGSNICE